MIVLVAAAAIAVVNVWWGGDSWLVLGIRACDQGHACYEYQCKEEVSAVLL